MHILLLKGHSRYGGTRLFTDLAAAALARAGHATDILDLTGTDRPDSMLMKHSRTARPDFVFSICIASNFRDDENRTISEMFDAPHVIWQTDYILNQRDRLRTTPRSTAMLMVDQTHADAVRATYGADRFDYLGFFPHPAVGEAAPDEANHAAFEATRPIEVLWSGSFQKPGTAWAAVPQNLQTALRDACDLALAQEWMAPHDALAAVLSDYGVDVSDPAHRGVLEFARFVDDAVRKTRRFEFVKAVAKTGVRLHIVGADWEPQLYRFKNATYEGPVDMIRMIELMRQSRVVLNTNGNFGAGSHERPFSASLAGAATFSDYSRYYQQAFGPGEIELYRWKDLGGGMEALKALAADPARCFEMGRAAKARTMAEHTWDRRIDLILQAAAAVGRATAP